MSSKKMTFFRRALCIATATILLSNFTRAQNPGGVSTGITFWLKANTPTPTNIVLNGSNVSQWKSEVGTFSVSQATASKQPAMQTTPASTVDFNFNPCVQFNYTAQQVLSNTATTPNLLGNTGTIFLLTNTRAGTAGGTLLTYYSNTSYRYQIKPDFRIQNGSSGIGYKFDLNAIPSVVIRYPRKAAIVLTSKGTGASSAGRRNGTDAGAPTGATSTFNPAINAGLYLGANATSEYANMAVSEVIFYSNVLTATEISKVESYLAMKFGITLNEVPGNNTDYVASDGTVVWNRTANAPYNNDITFIARDDASGLSQKQSRSVDSTSVVHLYNGTTGGTFPAMNTDNASTISSDLSFFGVGDNAASLNLTQCVLPTVHGAMARVWKVQKTGTGTGAITVAVNATEVSPLITNLLVSTSPTFATATIYPLSSSAGKLYADVNFTGNEYFTFATDSLKKPLSTNATVCAGSAASLQVSNPQTGVTYNWFGTSTGGSSIGSGNTITLPGINNDSTVWIEAVGPSGCIYPSRTKVDITAAPAPAAPTVNAASVCTNGTATLQVQSPVAGVTYNWFNVSSGGTALSTGTSFTTPSLTTTTTYYVEASSTTLSCTSPRIAVTVTVIATPSAPVVNAITICSGNTATLQVQSPVTGVVYTWYNVSTSGTALATGTSFTTPVLSTTTTYYVEAGSSSGNCTSTRTSVIVTVTPSPAAPVVNATSICSGNTSTLQVQSPVAGITYSWYNVSTGGTALSTGTSFTTPALTTTTTYYVEASNGTCTSSRIAVVVTVNAIPSAPVVNAITICGGNTATLQVQTPVAGVTYRWYNVATGGTALSTGTSYTTPSLSTTTTYYVEATGAGSCSSTRTAITVTVNPVPATPTATTTAVCPGSTATLQVQNPAAGITYSWFNVATGGTALASGTSYSVPNASASTYYVQATGVGGCSSIRVAVTVTLIQQLATPVVTVSATTMNSITFSWTAIAGAVGYEVSVDGGSYTVPSSGATGLTHTVTGLSQGQTVNISVRALGAQTCQQSNPGTASGKTLIGAQEIFVPNVFTPNGDGRNDQLRVYGTSIATLELRVFNQYGELIFETKDMNKGWDGTHKGKVQPSGVYLYVVKVVHVNGKTETKNGAVNLVR